MSEKEVFHHYPWMNATVVVVDGFLDVADAWTGSSSFLGGVARSAAAFGMSFDDCAIGVKPDRRERKSPMSLSVSYLQ
jgi:hypothetical protein